MTKTQFQNFLKSSGPDFQNLDHIMADQFGEYLDWNLGAGRTASAFIARMADEQDDYCINEAGALIQQ